MKKQKSFVTYLIVFGLVVIATLSFTCGMVIGRNSVVIPQLEKAVLELSQSVKSSEELLKINDNNATQQKETESRTEEEKNNDE